MKYSDDTNIYSVAELRGKSKSFTFESEVFRGILPSSQLLRNYDVVPVFAKAQEIVGNRIVFGNYELGYDFIGTYGVSDKGSVAGDYDGDINDITNEDVPTNDPYASIQPRAKLFTKAKEALIFEDEMSKDELEDIDKELDW